MPTKSLLRLNVLSTDSMNKEHAKLQYRNETMASAFSKSAAMVGNFATWQVNAI